MSAIKIDRNVPAPEFKGNRKYPWDEMKVGDSFFVPGGKHSGLRGPANNAAARIGNGCKFRCRELTEKGVSGARIWRVS